jgi:hypothetical protein
MFISSVMVKLAAVLGDNMPVRMTRCISGYTAGAVGVGRHTVSIYIGGFLRCPVKPL